MEWREAVELALLPRQLERMAVGTPTRRECSDTGRSARSQVSRAARDGATREESFQALRRLCHVTDSKYLISNANSPICPAHPPHLPLPLIRRALLHRNGAAQWDRHPPHHHHHPPSDGRGLNLPAAWRVHSSLSLHSVGRGPLHVMAAPGCSAMHAHQRRFRRRRKNQAAKDDTHFECKFDYLSRYPPHLPNLPLPPIGMELLTGTATHPTTTHPSHACA